MQMNILWVFIGCLFINKSKITFFQINVGQPWLLFMSITVKYLSYSFLLEEKIVVLLPGILIFFNIVSYPYYRKMNFFPASVIEIIFYGRND